MPSRIVREGIISSPRVNGLSLGAEVLYRRIMSVADDFGRYHGSILTLRVACFPTNPERFREKDIAKWLNELLRGENPLVRTYMIGGITYLEIQEFGQQRRGKSKFPDPPWFKNEEDTPKSAKQEISSPSEPCLASNVAGAQGSRSRIRIRSRISNAESYSLTREEATEEPPEEEPLADASLVCISDSPAKSKTRKAGRSSDDIEAALGPERMVWWSESWGIYPEKNGKKAAMDTYERKVHTRELAAKIYKGVQRYAAQVLGDPTLKVKYFQGWLTDERWEDEQTRARASPPGMPSAAQIRRSEVLEGFKVLDQIRGGRDAV